MNSIVFPGQGSQYVGMGKDLFDNFPEIKVIFEEYIMRKWDSQKKAHLLKRRKNLKFNTF